MIKRPIHSREAWALLVLAFAGLAGQLLAFTHQSRAFFLFGEFFHYLAVGRDFDSFHFVTCLLWQPSLPKLSYAILAF